MTFPLEIVNDTPSPEQLARARVIAAEHLPACDPERIKQCGIASNGRRVHGCRCLHEAMQNGSG